MQITAIQPIFSVSTRPFQTRSVQNDRPSRALMGACARFGTGQAPRPTGWWVPFAGLLAGLAIVTGLGIHQQRLAQSRPTPAVEQKKPVEIDPAEGEKEELPDCCNKKAGKK